MQRARGSRTVPTVRRAASLVLRSAALDPTLRADAPDLATEEARTVYALGVALAESVSSFDLSAEGLDLVLQGLADGVAQQPHVRYADYSSRVEALAKRRLDRTFEAQGRAGAEFRAHACAAHPDALVTASGAMAIPVREGTGERLSRTDTVSIAYEGRPADGTVLDRTRAGRPLTVPLEAAVAPCPSEGLHGMRAGAAMRLIYPPVRGFSHPRVKVGSTPVCDIELLGIVPQGEPQ